MSRGAPRILQYTINLNQFIKGRLNPHVPCSDAYDCGANSLLLLQLINEQHATELSHAQNYGNEKTMSANYLFKNYLFIDPEKKYEFRFFKDARDLLDTVQELKPGQGTFLFMKRKDRIGHFVCIQRELSGIISIIDLQENRVIRNLDHYFDDFNVFVIPTYVLKRDVEGEQNGKKTKYGGRRKRKTRKN